MLLALNLGVVALAAYRAGNYDFRAFYCAGLTARHAGDPYRTEPLYGCERTQTISNSEWLQAPLPAPFPPYAIAAVFEPLSRLPYNAAAGVWTALLVSASAGAAILMWRLTRLPVGAIVAAFSLSIGIPSIGFGEIVPLYLLFLCAAMWYARRGLWIAACACAAATLVEPHLGLPVCCAIAVAERRARVPLFVLGVLLAALSAATLGPAAIGEYLGPVLRYHALSELPSDQQFSLSTVLYWAGASARAAVAAGTVSYIAALVAGVLAGRALSLRFRDAAFAIAVPAAFAVAGGVFVHQTQIVAAIPLAMLLIVRSGARVVPVLMLIALAIPWVWDITPLIAAAGSIAALAIALELLPIRDVFRTAAPAVAALIVLVFLAHSPHLQTHAMPAMDPRYPESGWAHAVWTNISTGSLDAWLRRLPAWCGIAAVIIACAALCIRRRNAMPVPARAPQGAAL